MPVLPSCIIEPLWDQFAALLPDRVDSHPLGCHRRRIPDRIVFDKLLCVLVFGSGYERIADTTCSDRTQRRRRDEWTALGVMQQMWHLALAAYDRMVGLELSDLAIDSCITKAPCGGEVAGRSPVDRGNHGLKRSMITDATGIPVGVVPAASRNGHTCWAQPWTPWASWTGWVLSPSCGPCTWTAATTIRLSARCWPSAACLARSPSGACPHRSRSAAAESSSVPMPGATPLASCAAAPSGADSRLSSTSRWPVRSSLCAHSSAGPAVPVGCSSHCPATPMNTYCRTLLARRQLDPRFGLCTSFRQGNLMVSS
jgi:transposase